MSPAFVRDNRTTVVPGPDRGLRLVDAANGQVLLRLSGHTSSIGAIALSSDGRRLASGEGGNSSSDGTVRLWNVDGGFGPTTTQPPRLDTDKSWAISSQNRHAVFASQTSRGSITHSIDLLREHPPISLERQYSSPNAMKALVHGADGTRLAGVRLQYVDQGGGQAASRYEITILDTTTAKPVVTLGLPVADGIDVRDFDSLFRANDRPPWWLSMARSGRRLALLRGSVRYEPPCRADTGGKR